MKNLFLVFFLGCFFPAFGQNIEWENSNPAPVKGDKLSAFKYITGEDESFFKQLNEAGKLGYKLQIVTRIPPDSDKEKGILKLAAILRLKVGDYYEYGWLDPEAAVTYNPDSTVGFDIFESIPYYFTANDLVPSKSEKRDTDAVFDNVFSSILFTYGNIFILERSNGGRDQRDYELLTSELGYGKTPSQDLLEGIIEKSKDGFRPVSVYSGKRGLTTNISILATKEKNAVPNGAARYEYQFVRSVYGIGRKIEQRAAQGFKLVYFGQNILAQNFALMSKENGNKAPFSYLWIDADDDSYPVRIKKAAEQGFVYHSVVWNGVIEKKLVFEKSAETAPKYDYKILNLNPRVARQSGKSSRALRLPAPQETKAAAERLLTEGYIIRDLFYSEFEGVCLLFEKALN